MFCEMKLIDRKSRYYFFASGKRWNNATRHVELLICSRKRNPEFRSQKPRKISVGNLAVGSRQKAGKSFLLPNRYSFYKSYRSYGTYRTYTKKKEKQDSEHRSTQQSACAAGFPLHLITVVGASPRRATPLPKRLRSAIRRNRPLEYGRDCHTVPGYWA